MFDHKRKFFSIIYNLHKQFKKINNNFHICNLEDIISSTSIMLLFEFQNNILINKYTYRKASPYVKKEKPHHRESKASNNSGTAIHDFQETHFDVSNK